MERVFYILCVFLFMSTQADWVAEYGPFKAILYSDWISCNHSKDSDLNVSATEVFFYDFQNDFNYSFPIGTAAEAIQNAYRLDVTRRLIVFVPGYKSHIVRNAPELMRAAFKNVPNVYLMIVDHSIYTSAQGGSIKSYERSVNYAYDLGRAVGQLLLKFHLMGFQSNNIHCIGHSLGGQILGYAGIQYANMTSEKLWRITGIDPAGPCFSNSLIEDQLRSGCAEYVEVYHCNAGGLGTTSVLADTDFFLNDGKIQPRCDASFLSSFGDSEAKCSHKSCVKYWTQTVGNSAWYLAWQCDSYKAFSKGKCAANPVTIAGYWNPGNATGVFYASTDTYGVI